MGPCVSSIILMDLRGEGWPCDDPNERFICLLRRSAFLAFRFPCVHVCYVFSPTSLHHDTYATMKYYESVPVLPYSMQSRPYDGQNWTGIGASPQVDFVPSWTSVRAAFLQKWTCCINVPNIYGRHHLNCQKLRKRNHVLDLSRKLQLGRPSMHRSTMNVSASLVHVCVPCRQPGQCPIDHRPYNPRCLASCRPIFWQARCYRPQVVYDKMCCHVYPCSS